MGLLTLKVSLEYFVSHFPIFSHTKLFVIVPVLFTKVGADPKHSHTRLLLLFPFVEIIPIIPQHEEVDDIFFLSILLRSPKVALNPAPKVALS